ncbi:MAG: hypothetical protein JJE29_03880 [Peptostreptococcaceae bacterium]|nr:hypothetical protein [Peptostreptococcaceae bacterium]
MMKAELPWLKEVDSIAIQSSVKFLGEAFSGFFTKRKGYPNFKSKKHSRQSYTTKFTNGNIAFWGNRIKLPKLGLVKFAKSREVQGADVVGIEHIKKAISEKAYRSNKRPFVALLNHQNQL